MEQIRHIPEFHHAQPEHVRLVYDPNQPPLSGSESIRANISLRKKQTFVGEVGSLAALKATETDETEMPFNENWQSVINQTAEWVDRYLQKKDFIEYSQLIGVSPGEANDHVRQVSRDGIQTAAAFLEVIPHILRHNEFADPNQEIAEYARRSQGFVLEWTRVLDDVDSPLAASLASPQPRRIDRRGKLDFSELRFDPKWFKEHEGHVILDPEKIGELYYISTKTSRNGTYTKKRVVHPGEKDNNSEPSFGCPGRHFVPYIYNKMLNLAFDAGLFEQTYYAAQQESMAELTLA